MTPYEALYHVKPKISHLRTYGTSCYINILSEKRPAGSKLHSGADVATFIGYTSTSHIYRIQESNKHIRSVPSNEYYFPKNSTPTAPSSVQLSDAPTTPETESGFADFEMHDPVRITHSNESKNFEISVPPPPEDAH